MKTFAAVVMAHGSRDTPPVNHAWPGHPRLLRLTRAALATCALLLVCAEAHAEMAPAEEKPRCEALAGGRFNLVPGAPTEIVSASHAAADGAMPAYCAVDGYVNPVDNFGLMLPDRKSWNGKYIVRGCGGSCGSVVTKLACSSHVRDGYACLITDMGHRSTLIDNVWVADNLPGRVDFGFRATHVTAVAGRAILTAYYDGPPKLSYFMGCSTGGRQALVEAERFPQDFDGIVAIAPASMGPFSGGTATVPSIDDLNRGPDGRAILPNRKIPMLHRAVLAACDAKDGVSDGLIANPQQCRFDPASLLCRAGDRQDCLTGAQVDVVHRIYTQRKAAIGSELSWIDVYLHDADPVPAPNPYAARGDGAVEESLVSPADPDLSPFKSHGGKLILAHGWADPSVMPGPTVDFYRLATRAMGGPDATTDFFRLFMVPGMRHCSGGEGAYGIDYIAALENWVEKKHAPDKLIGVQPKPGVKLDFFSIDLPLLKSSDFAFTRAYFPYPLLSVYSGHGNPDDEASFVPVPPDTPAASASPVSGSGTHLANAHTTPADRLRALRDTMDRSELWGTAAGFPRSYIVAGIAAAMLVDIDAEQLSGSAEGALLDQVAAQSLSSAEIAALPIIRPQIKDDR